MKKIFFSLAAVAAIVAGCTKELIEEPVSPVDGTYTIKASIADDTKTSIDGEGNMAWIAGDKIGVYDGSFHTFTLKDGATAEEAIFNGELDNPSNAALAVCPDGIGVDVADEIVEFNLPSEYTYDGQSTHAFMIASGFSVNDKTATIKFKHIGGLFKVTYNNVPEEAVAFCFEATKQIAGAFYIEDYTDKNAALAVAESETGKTVSYSIASTDDHSSMSFYVPVPVGEFGFNISLKDEGGNKIAKSSKTKNSISIVKGYYVDIPAINMPRKWVENFDNTKITDTKVGNGSNFTTSGNTEGFDYEWSSNGSVYVFHDGIRLGSGSATGSVKNSSILTNVPAGPFTVKVYAAVWNTDGGKISVTYNGTTLEASPANASISAPTTTDYSAEAFAKASDFVFNKAQDINEFTVGSTQKRIIIDKIEIVEGGVLPEPFSVSTESLTPAWDDTEATFDITAGNNVNWTIGAVEGLTFSNSSGNGNATITVSFAQNEGESQIQKEILVSTNYESVEGEKEYTISFTQAGKPAIELDGDGSVENPYSVADALYICGNLDSGESTAENYYVAGPIFSVGTLSSGSLTYYIGTSDESKIQIYKGKDLGNSNFSATSDLSVGNNVVVNGKIFNYQGTTPEINTPNYIYSINGATSILTGITLGEKKTEYYTGEEFVKPAVTASYRGKASATVTDATTFNGYDLTTPGEQTVKASYTEGGIEKEETYGITVYNGAYYTISSSVNNEAMGSVSVKVNGESATQAREGEEVTVTITPNSDYIFSSLTLNGEDKTSQVSGGEFTFDMPASDASIYVTFADKPEETTVSTDQFTAISGNLDNNIAFAAAKGDAANNPIIPSNETFIRIYQNGGTFTVTPNNGATITEVVIGSNQATSVTYSIDGGSSSSSNSITANGTLTVSKSVSDNIVFTCKGTNNTSRLEVNYLKVTYYGGQEKTPLASPTSFVCSAKTSSSLTFTWAAVTNATGYKVSTDGGQNYSETLANTSYTWTGLDAETSYTLYVKAVDESNLYLDSDPVSAQGTTDEAGQGGGGTLKITRENFSSGALAYNATDIWSVVASTGETVTGEGDLYSTANQTTMQSKNSGVSTMYHNTIAVPGNITKITLKCASGTTRTYTAYMNTTTVITKTSEGTSKGTIAPTAGNTASLSLEASDGWRYFWLNLAGGASFLDYIEIEYTN